MNRFVKPFTKTKIKAPTTQTPTSHYSTPVPDETNNKSISNSTSLSRVKLSIIGVMD